MTVALLQYPFPRGPSTGAEYELIPRMTAGWTDAERRRFIAWNVLFDAENCLPGVDLSARTFDAPRVDWFTRETERRGPLSRLIWLHVKRDGALIVEVVDVPRE